MGRRCVGVGLLVLFFATENGQSDQRAEDSNISIVYSLVPVALRGQK